MTNGKWTVRGVRSETVERVNELRDECETTAGSLINQAVEMFYFRMRDPSRLDVEILASEFSGRLVLADLKNWKAD